MKTVNFQAQNNHHIAYIKIYIRYIEIKQKKTPMVFYFSHLKAADGKSRCPFLIVGAPALNYNMFIVYIYYM